MVSKLYTINKAQQEIQRHSNESLSIYCLCSRPNKRDLGRKYSPSELIFDGEEMNQLSEKRYNINKEECMKQMQKTLETQKITSRAKNKPRSTQYLEVKKEIIKLFHKKWTPVQLQKMKESILNVAKA